MIVTKFYDKVKWPFFKCKAYPAEVVKFLQLLLTMIESNI